jgi:hypothetical protein
MRGPHPHRDGRWRSMVAFRPHSWEGGWGARRQEARRVVDTVKSLTGAAAWWCEHMTTTLGECVGRVSARRSNRAARYVGETATGPPAGR